MQPLQADYFAAYRNLKLSRDDKGVLVAEFHSDGGPFIMDAQAHTEFVDAFHRIGQDRANKIVIITGAGESFIGDVEWTSFGDVADPGVWSRIHDEGRPDFREHCEHPRSGDRGRRGTRPYPLGLRAPC